MSQKYVIVNDPTERKGEASRDRVTSIRNGAEIASPLSKYAYQNQQRAGVEALPPSRPPGASAVDSSRSGPVLSLDGNRSQLVTSDLDGDLDSVPPQGETPVVRQDILLAKPAAAIRSAAFSAVRGVMASKKPFKTRLVSDVAVTSSAGGTYYAASTIYTVVASLGEFGDFLNVFDEWRVTHVKCTFIPFTPNKIEAGVNANGRALCITYDPNDASVPSSILGTFASADAKVFSNMKEWKHTFRLLDNNLWFSTLTTTNPLQPSSSIKIAGDANLGASLPIGTLYYEWFVEFRSRR